MSGRITGHSYLDQCSGSFIVLSASNVPFHIYNFHDLARITPFLIEFRECSPSWIPGTRPTSFPPPGDPPGVLSPHEGKARGTFAISRESVRIEH